MNKNPFPENFSLMAFIKGDPDAPRSKRIARVLFWAGFALFGVALLVVIGLFAYAMLNAG